MQKAVNDVAAMFMGFLWFRQQDISLITTERLITTVPVVMPRVRSSGRPIMNELMAQSIGVGWSLNTTVPVVMPRVRSSGRPIMNALMAQSAARERLRRA